MFVISRDLRLAIEMCDMPPARYCFHGIRLPTGRTTGEYAKRSPSGENVASLPVGNGRECGVSLPFIAVRYSRADRTSFIVNRISFPSGVHPRTDSAFGCHVTR